MPSQGPSYASTATTASLPGVAWDDTADATGATDGVGASCDGPGDSDWLVLTGYGFSIPGGATITDVAAVIRVKDDTGASPLFYAQLVVDGGGVGGEQDLTGEVTSSYSDVTASGSPAGYWGTTLTAAEANGDGFGVRCRFESLLTGNAGRVDAVAVTVTYTGGAGEASQRLLRNVG